MSSSQVANPTMLTRGRDKVHRLLSAQVYPRLGFPVAIASIARRSNIGMVRRSHIRDFELGFPAPGRGLNLREFTPYYADYRREILYFSRMLPDCDGRRAFFYMAQREFSDQIAAIGLGRLDEIRDVGFAGGADPLLIFSIGRCGSTLLSKLMIESGVSSFSEPDIFSQTAELSGELGRRLGHGEAKIRDYREKILGVTLQSLYARASQPTVCVKMRSGSTRVFPEIIEAYPKAVSVFLLREVESWAKSWITAFGANMDKMTRKLTSCVQALDRARETGVAHRLVWYEEIEADPGAACAKVLGVTAAAGGGTPGDIGRVMRIDSQRETALSAEALDRRRSDDAQMIARDTGRFLNAWRTAQPSDLLRKHGLTGLVV